MVSPTNDSRSRGACDSNTKDEKRATSACRKDTAHKQEATTFRNPGYSCNKNDKSGAINLKPLFTAV